MCSFIEVSELNVISKYFLLQLVPPIGMLNNPMNAVTTKFVRTSTNKVKCPVFVVRVSRVLELLCWAVLI